MQTLHLISLDTLLISSATGLIAAILRLLSEVILNLLVILILLTVLLLLHLKIAILALITDLHGLLWHHWAPKITLIIINTVLMSIVHIILKAGRTCTHLRLIWILTVIILLVMT